MPSEALISRVEQALSDVAILGGKAETTSMVTGLEVVDISITGQPNLILVKDSRDGDFIYAVKVPGVIYAVSDLVTVLFIDGTEPVAIQQSAGSGGSPVAVSKLVSPDLTIDPVISADNSGDVTIAGTGDLIIPAQIIHSGDTDNNISFTSDRQTYNVGGIAMLTLREAGQDVITLGPGSGDVDINFNGDMFLKGDDGSFGIGTTIPAAERLQMNSSNATAYADTVPSIANVQMALINTADGANVFSGFEWNNSGNSQNRISYMGAISESTVNRKMSFVIGTDSGTDRNERMRITGDGNVGIGNTSPDSPLVVAGESFIGPTAASGNTSNSDVTIGLTINMEANDDQALALKSSDVAHGVTDQAETDTYYFVKKAGAANGGASMIAISEANIAYLNQGIATTESSAKSTSAIGIIEFRAALKSGTGITTAGTDANLLVIRNNTTSRFIFDAEGDGHANSSWVTFSDRRLKSDIVDIPYGLDELMALQPRQFVKNDRLRIGLVAQEVKNIIPESVKPVNEADSFYSLDYDSLIALLISAIQELKIEVEELKNDGVN